MLKASLLFSLAALASTARALAPVVISHQGPVYWALPIHIATERGYFEMLELEPSFEVYPSGAPQVAAAVDDMAWDVGAAGVVPNIIGGPLDIQTIGISNDESATNAMAGTADGVAAWPPANISDTTIALTANSTVHYAVEACLAKEGYDLMDANFSFGPPADVLASGEDYLGLWAPNLYLFLENNDGSEVVCSGADAGATVPGGIMVRKAFGEENGETVAKVLAAWLRGIEFIKDPKNRAQVLEYMKEFYAIYNVTISDAAMEQEIDKRPIFTLEKQLDLMDRTDGPSTVDDWFSGVSAFMFNAGVLSEDPAPETYITDAFMQMVKDDAELRLFALRENSTSTDPTSAAVTFTSSIRMLAGMAGAMFVATTLM